MANQNVFPICRATCPSPVPIPGTHSRSAARVSPTGLLKLRGGATVRHPMGPPLSRGEPLPPGRRTSVCLCARGSWGDAVVAPVSSRSTQARCHSLHPGRSIPPACPVTGPEPPSRGEPARWLEPRPLGASRTLIGQRASPSLATPPWSVVQPRGAVLGLHWGVRGRQMGAAWTWGLRANTSPPSPVIRGRPGRCSLPVQTPGSCHLSDTQGRSSHLSRGSELLKSVL